MVKFKTSRESQEFFVNKIENFLVDDGIKFGDDAWYDAMQAKFEAWKPMLFKDLETKEEKIPYHRLYEERWGVSQTGEEISPEEVYLRLVRGNELPFEEETHRKEAVTAIRRKYIEKLKQLMQEEYYLAELARSLYGRLKEIGDWELYPRMARLCQKVEPLGDLWSEEGAYWIWTVSYSQFFSHLSSEEEKKLQFLKDVFSREKEVGGAGPSSSSDWDTRQEGNHVINVSVLPPRVRGSVALISEYVASVHRQWNALIQGLRQEVAAL